MRVHIKLFRLTKSGYDIQDCFSFPWKNWHRLHMGKSILIKERQVHHETFWSACSTILSNISFEMGFELIIFCQRPNHATTVSVSANFGSCFCHHFICQLSLWLFSAPFTLVVDNQIQTYISAHCHGRSQKHWIYTICCRHVTLVKNFFLAGKSCFLCARFQLFIIQLLNLVSVVIRMRKLNTGSISGQLTGVSLARPAHWSAFVQLTKCVSSPSSLLEKSRKLRKYKKKLINVSLYCASCQNSKSKQCKIIHAY